MQRAHGAGRHIFVIGVGGVGQQAGGLVGSRAGGRRLRAHWQPLECNGQAIRLNGTAYVATGNVVLGGSAPEWGAGVLSPTTPSLRSGSASAVVQHSGHQWVLARHASELPASRGTTRPAPKGSSRGTSHASRASVTNCVFLHHHARKTSVTVVPRARLH